MKWIMLMLLGALTMPEYAAELPAPLSEEEKAIIVGKGTEAPYSGRYNDFFHAGLYLCRQCGSPLYRSDDKFNSGCGWPAFDDAFDGAVKQTTDPDGHRNEITCARCDGHLGHVFHGEKLTPRNTRHCVNSRSMSFVASDDPRFGRALVAGGCFWGVEYYLRQIDGVLYTTVGYCGGATTTPVYEQVCGGNTGHAEAVEVIFDPGRTSYEDILRVFLETHDPTQLNRQGPDIGSQYRSAIFYYNTAQREVGDRLLKTLRLKGYDVVTELKPAGRFWPGEGYHRQYYQKKGSQPYCHQRVKRF